MTDPMKKFSDLSPANTRQAPVAKSDYYTVKTGQGFNAATTDIIRVTPRSAA